MKTKAQEHKPGDRYYIIQTGRKKTLIRVKLHQIRLFLELHGDLLLAAGDTEKEAILDLEARQGGSTKC